MKSIYLILSCLFVTATAFAQSGTNPCPAGYAPVQCTFLYTYDDAGNRIDRSKTACTCEIIVANKTANPTDANAVAEDYATLTAQIVSIAPNPTTQGIRVQFSAPVENAKLHIIDSNGKLLGTQTVSGTSAEADLSAYTAGVYYVSLHTNEAVHTQKVVKID